MLMDLSLYLKQVINEETLIKKEINILINKIITFLHSIFFLEKNYITFYIRKIILYNLLVHF